MPDENASVSADAVLVRSGKADLDEERKALPKRGGWWRRTD